MVLRAEGRVDVPVGRARAARRRRLAWIRYQLLHRTASAVIEARRFGAHNAVMLVHSLRADPRVDRGLRQIREALRHEMDGSPYFVHASSAMSLFTSVGSRHTTSSSKAAALRPALRSCLRARPENCMRPAPQGHLHSIRRPPDRHLVPRAQGRSEARTRRSRLCSTTPSGTRAANKQSADPSQFGTAWPTWAACSHTDVTPKAPVATARRAPLRALGERGGVRCSGPTLPRELVHRPAAATAGVYPDCCGGWPRRFRRGGSRVARRGGGERAREPR